MPLLFFYALSFLLMLFLLYLSCDGLVPAQRLSLARSAGASQRGAQRAEGAHMAALLGRPEVCPRRSFGGRAGARKRAERQGRAYLQAGLGFSQGLAVSAPMSV